jgi:hypothetical protein
MSYQDYLKHMDLVALATKWEEEVGRNWVPWREDEVIFSRHFTKEGVRYDASDYGHKAFPMTTGGKYVEINRPAKPRVDVPIVEPILSARTLPGGLVAGDRIEHAVHGPGMILSMARGGETVLLFDWAGLKRIPTATAHLVLRRPGTSALSRAFS